MGFPICVYSAIQLCTKYMMGFLESLESSPSPDQMKICGNFLRKWNFSGILFGGLLARIAEYLLNGSPREVKFHSQAPFFGDTQLHWKCVHPHDAEMHQLNCHELWQLRIRESIHRPSGSLLAITRIFCSTSPTCSCAAMVLIV